MTFSLPPRQALASLLAALWAILVGAVRIFAWDSLKEGFIDVRPLPRAARLLALVGLVVVFLFLGSILFNDALRFSGTLQPLPLSSSSVRGIFVPTAAVPLALAAVLLAWAFLLTGALHTRALMRWGVFLAFLAFGLPSVVAGSLQLLGSHNQTLQLTSLAIILGSVVGLVIALLLLPRLRLPLAVEFTFVLSFVSGVVLVGLFASAQASLTGRVDFVTGYFTPDAVTFPRVLIAPLLYLSGAEIINFGVTFTSWGARSTQKFASRWVVVVMLLALLAWRWIDFIWHRALPGVLPHQVLAWIGALLVVLGLAPIAFWRLHRPFPDRVPLKLLLGLIVGLLALQLILSILVGLVSAVFQLDLSNPNALNELDRATAPLLALSNFYRDFFYLVIAISGVVIAVVAARRKRYTVAAFGVILAWTQFLWWLMENGRPLEALRFRYEDIDIYLLLAITMVALYWLARRQLTSDRALRLFGLALFAWVLNNTAFLDNPISLLFGIVGLSFTAFGILWGVLTAGGRFANYDSKGFPRINRILLYLGYVLLTVNITHWYIVTHDVEGQLFSSDLTAAGLRIFGLTAAYLVFVEGGRALIKES